MKDIFFTVPILREVIGKNRLDIFNKGALNTRMTDFALLLGGNNENIWWTRTSEDYMRKYVIRNDRDTIFAFNKRTPGVRPLFDYSDFNYMNEYYDENGILCVKYGEFPQDLVTDEESDELEKLFLNNELKKVGQFTTDGVSNECWEITFRERFFDEYEYNGRKFIRFVADYITFQNDKYREDNVKFKYNKSYWIEVKPIEWMIDTCSKKAISKNILIAGIQYGGFTNGKYLHDYLNTYFKNEINMKKYNIVDKNNNLDCFIEWSKENNIYPLIDLFLISKHGKYLDYDWKTISNHLCRYGNIYGIEGLLDEKVFMEFIDFCNIGMSMDDILSKKVDINKISKSKKYIICLLLFLNRDIEIENAREFILELGNEYLLLYDDLCNKYKKEVSNLVLK